MSNRNSLPRSTPEDQGVSSGAVLAFLDGIQSAALELHSLMLVRHGHVVAEGWWSPYGPQRPHMLYSLSKSFTSTAIGLAVTEGRLRVTDRVVDFFPESLPPVVSANLAEMRVRQLLSMSTGHQDDTLRRIVRTGGQDWVKAFLALKVEHKPGTHFVYNSGATYMLSAILQKVTGQTLLEYLTPRLFAPLGIQHPTWESCPKGINTGGWGLSITTEDIARFGQLYLQQGWWNGEQLVPQAWIVEASARQVSNGSNPDSDWEQGYGYQFWRSRNNAYRGDGAFGQFCIVLPKHDAVVAITSGENDMQAVLNQVWQHLLPGIGADPLPASVEEQQELRDRLDCLAYNPPSGETHSPMEFKVGGKHYHFPANNLHLERVMLEFSKTGARLSAWLDGARHDVEIGRGRWLEGTTGLFPTDRGPVEQRVAASGVWVKPDTFQATLRLYETPYTHTLTCRFTGDSLTLKQAVNVSFEPVRARPLVGRLE